MTNKRSDISSLRELIQGLICEDYRHDDILSRVNVQLNAQNQRPISLITLRRFIRDWSLDKANLDSVRELIQTLIHEGSRQSDILQRVNEQLSAQNQRAISLRTLQRNIKKWGFKQIDTNSVRELIQTQLGNGDQPLELIEHVNTQLSAQNQCTVSLRALQRYLKEWGLDRKTKHARFLEESYEDITELIVQDVPMATILRSMNGALEGEGLPGMSERMFYSHLESWGFQRQERVRITDELVDRVRFRFFSYGHSDRLILRGIQQCDNLPCTAYAIRKIRYQHGMKRRCRTEEERLSTLQRAIEFIESDLQRSPAILNFGREYLYVYVRQQGQVLVSKNPLYNIYRQIFPEQVQSRSPGNLMHRGNFRVPGPNFFWCLDGYEKLSRFGFEVYACIDAYSRCIIWLYCGRSATTALSTLKQYLRTVKTLGMRPLLTRSDRGRETPLWVSAQATLADANPVTVTYEDANGNQRTFTQGNRLNSCHHYGQSTRNVRIESWWRSLRSAAAQTWIRYFNILDHYQEFEGTLADQIALYATYGSKIREMFANFVELSNAHTIRKQNNREHVVSGKPIDLYCTEDVQNWGVHIGEDDDADDRMALNQMLDPLESVDIDRLLSQETEDWCDARLEEMGFFEAPITNPEEPHREFYLCLRQQIQEHQESGARPILELSPIPLGGLSEYMRLLEEFDRRREDSSPRGSSIPSEFLED
ncbi:hypothetical protein E4U28_007049 [Claviceps purpurea]|nr:hypothetical protein E4U28_007049 [Claviceps purpurea]